MKDRIPKYPGRVKLTPVSGQTDVFDMVRADEPEEAGTPINKQTLLTDETAEKLGLDPSENPTPDQALAAILVRMLADGDGVMLKMLQIMTGDTDTGIENGSGSKIFGYSADGNFRVGDSTFPLAFFGSAANPKYNSFDMLKVQTGSYSGTGKCGESQTKNKITFSFTPKIVIVYATELRTSNSTTEFMIAIYGTTATHTQSIYDKRNQGSYVEVRGNGNILSWTSTTLTWYFSINNSTYAYAQLNASGETYKWIAIG